MVITTERYIIFWFITVFGWCTTSTSLSNDFGGTAQNSQIINEVLEISKDIYLMYAPIDRSIVIFLSPSFFSIIALSKLLFPCPKILSDHSSLRLPAVYSVLSISVLCAVTRSNQLLDYWYVIFLVLMLLRLQIYKHKKRRISAIQHNSHWNGIHYRSWDRPKLFVWLSTSWNLFRLYYLGGNMCTAVSYNQHKVFRS